MKTLFKELFIIILLSIAIILILGIIFYNYIPSNKPLPQKVAYEMPEDIEKELQESVSQESAEVIVKYELDDIDMKVYKENKSYVNGKPNPFDAYKTNNNNATTGTPSGGTTGNQSNSRKPRKFK